MWNWSNIALIYQRELRDQLRDRRTMFTVVVLPLLLYPLIGATFIQVSQFMREHPNRILLVGAEHLPSSPPLIEEKKFSSQVCGDHESSLLSLEFLANEQPSLEAVQQQAQADLQSGKYDAVMFIPVDFSERLTAFQQELKARAKERSTPMEQFQATIPQPIIFKNTASDRSRMAFLRLDAVLENWRSLIARENLAETSVPWAATKPFEVVQTDVAESGRRRAAVWSKILPFVLLVWALTGAFYPAVDVCAGEKERGTLETLLCSPALRTEIVWGKLLTVMTFSMATALLNLLGMGTTGLLIVRQMEQLQAAGADFQFGPPPWYSLLWLLVALPPMSALFSALSLAIAAFARSSKEGQYYLMPLLMVMLPLMTLSTLPSAQLDLGSSMVPVTGLMLLLRSLMEGQVWDSLRFSVPVIVVTALCCWLAIRWAVDQFNRESVLFRENEQWGIGLWLKHIRRDRGDTPSFAESLLCAVLLLVIGFFARLYAKMPENWAAFRNDTAIGLVAFILIPAVVMALVLTRRPALTLLLKRPSFLLTVPAAVMLAICLNPAIMWFGQGISYVYPMSEHAQLQLKPILAFMQQAPLWQLVLLIGLTPAICEELAFRGFILSGFRHVGNKWTAIVLTAAFFGFAHGVFQQSIATFFVGIVLGYVAVKTGSIFPAMAFHFASNALTVLTQRITDAQVEAYPWLQFVFQTTEQGRLYTPWFACFTACLAAAILFWLKSLPYEATREEVLQDALERDSLKLNMQVATR
jgi:sodium transport system permease protein